jgi:hypothetical protein
VIFLKISNRLNSAVLFRCPRAANCPLGSDLSPVLQLHPRLKRLISLRVFYVRSLDSQPDLPRRSNCSTATQMGIAPFAMRDVCSSMVLMPTLGCTGVGKGCHL